ncbi:exported hypothetical protein [Candidatus Zixiibacteriota bacterium]|nr:exported hypothetical protein [candidate division Zixibacteria bacterium]
MPLKSVFAIAIFPVFFYLLTGCASTPQKGSLGEETRVRGSDRQGNAFLFDIKVTRNGKMNSARLDIYQNGDSLSLFARGYLGKGALKGLLTPDSIIVYFPLTGEYYTGKLADLVSDSCRMGQNLEHLLASLFNYLPDSVELPSDISLQTLKDEKKSKQYHLESGGCRATMDLRYDYRDNRFLPESINFGLVDGSFHFAGERRNFRLNIHIPEDKFEIYIPETAARIYPR